MALEAVGSSPITHPILIFASERKPFSYSQSYSQVPELDDGMSPSGKAPDFDSGIRRFESCHPSQFDPLAQLAEQLPFKQWVRRSNRRRVTTNRQPVQAADFVITMLSPGGAAAPPGFVRLRLRILAARA